jgi:lipopolysaccharide export system protein LptA
MSGIATVSLKRGAVALGPFVVTLACAGACFCQTKPLDLKDLKELNLIADNFNVVGNTITATGNAKVTLGKTVLTADKIVAKRNDEMKPLPFETITATGNVKVTHEKHLVEAKEARFDGRTAIIEVSSVTAKLIAKKKEFNLSADKVTAHTLFQDITATGNVKVSHPNGEAEAESVHINLLTETMEVHKPKIRLMLK